MGVRITTDKDSNTFTRVSLLLTLFSRRKFRPRFGSGFDEGEELISIVKLRRYPFSEGQGDGQQPLSGETQRSVSFALTNFSSEIRFPDLDSRVSRRCTVQSYGIERREEGGRGGGGRGRSNRWKRREIKRPPGTNERSSLVRRLEILLVGDSFTWKRVNIDRSAPPSWFVRRARISSYRRRWFTARRRESQLRKQVKR